jgi:hypothetical protein
MARKIITSFFTNNGTPATGLSPTTKIWELNQTNPAINTIVINGAAMVEIGDGWYRYDFVTYDPNKSYVITTDGGGILPTYERYSVAANETYAEEVTDIMMNEVVASDYNTPGSFGAILNQTHANTSTILTTCVVDMSNVLDLLEELLMYDQNRTKLDKIAKTLTIYANDNVTPIKIFDLKDSNGLPSVSEVCDRIPRP